MDSSKENEVSEDHRGMTRPETPTGTKPYPAIKCTPAKHHSTQEHSYLNGTLDDMRECVIKDLDYTAVEVGIEPFFNNILPPLKKNIDVDEIIEALKRDGYIVNERSGGGTRQVLRDFRTEPRHQNQKEDDVFSALGVFCDKAVELASDSLEGLQPTFVLHMRPNHAPRSHRESKTRPDAYFSDYVGDDDGSTMQWYRIGSTMEFKKEDGVKQRDDNKSKIVFNIHQTLAFDPCRRFTFGISVENRDMRVWFCSRSIPVVTEAFNFTTDIKLLVHVLLAFSFTSKEELGWDPTIQPATKSNGERVYHIQVGSDTYETGQVLAESGADALVSRAARIWKVTNRRTGEAGVLKDIWIEHDRELEHNIHGRILRDVEIKYDPDTREEVAKHLLTPVAHWIVQVNGVEDHTTNVMMRRYEPPFDKGFHLKAYKPKIIDQKKAIQPSVASDRVASGPRRGITGRHILSVAHRVRLHHRKHYRVVFKEVGLCLHTVRNLSDVFTVLRDSAKVLKWIHGCGWLHRDISISNLYLYDGRGLVGDLEYAKHKDCAVFHEVRSCSIDFLANEVIRNEFRFRPFDTSNPWPVKKVDNRKEEPERIVHFFEFDLHDLESLFWIALWVLLFNRSSSDEVQDEEWDDVREHAIQKLFPRSDEIEERENALKYIKHYLPYVDWMTGTLYEIAGLLRELTKCLIGAYLAFEAPLPNVQWELLEEAHDIFTTELDKCRWESNGIELTPYKTTGLRNLELSAEHESRAQVGNRLAASPRLEMKTTEDLFSEMAVNDGNTRSHRSKGDSNNEDDNCDNTPFLFRVERFDLNQGNDLDGEE